MHEYVLTCVEFIFTLYFIVGVIFSVDIAVRKNSLIRHLRVSYAHANKGIYYVQRKVPFVANEFVTTEFLRT